MHTCNENPQSLSRGCIGEGVVYKVLVRQGNIAKTLRSGLKSLQTRLYNSRLLSWCSTLPGTARFMYFALCCFARASCFGNPRVLTD